ncbi:unnamed protein product [Prunus armeniaca]
MKVKTPFLRILTIVTKMVQVRLCCALEIGFLEIERLDQDNVSIVFPLMIDESEIA